MGSNDLLLTPKEFAVLLFLAEKEGEIISAEAIHESVWKQSLGDDTSTLRMTISNIRKKIDPSGYTINVNRGQGYVFEQI
jgi:DNA-binding response OmpR family regulator